MFNNATITTHYQRKVADTAESPKSTHESSKTTRKVRKKKNLQTSSEGESPKKKKTKMQNRKRKRDEEEKKKDSSEKIVQDELFALQNVNLSGIQFNIHEQCETSNKLSQFFFNPSLRHNEFFLFQMFLLNPRKLKSGRIISENDWFCCKQI